MKIERTKIPNVVIFTPDVYEDDRGYFIEAVNKFSNFNVAQINVSKSKKGVIRGLHGQLGTAKLVWVVKGSIYDVAFDANSGKYIGETLSADNHKQLFVPDNCFHGFQALEDDTIVCYAMSMVYNANEEVGLNPSRIQWPLKEQIISDKDKNAEKPKDKLSL